jgi:hypothetical protein
LNLYVYVGNNPLKYRDPTGHVKTKIEQENAEEGAIGGINKHTNSSHQPPLLNQGLSTSLAMGLGI